MATDREEWLSGPVDGIPALLQPTAHALLQVRKELRALLSDFPDELLWVRPAGVASVGFHLQHLTGVLDRLFTYARGEQLSEAQLDALRAEGTPPGAEALPAMARGGASSMGETPPEAVASLAMARGGTSSMGETPPEAVASLAMARGGTSSMGETPPEAGASLAMAGGDTSSRSETPPEAELLSGATLLSEAGKELDHLNGPISNILVDHFHNQVDKVLLQLAATDPGTLAETRYVGRARIPSTVIGLLMHATEHTTRHYGQLLVTVKTVKVIR